MSLKIPACPVKFLQFERTDIQRRPFRYKCFQERTLWRDEKQIPDFVFIEASVGKDPDQRNYIVYNAKIEATGYKSEFSLDRGITDLIKGYTIIRNAQGGNV